MGAAVRRGERPAVAQPLAAPLHLVASPREPLDAVVVRDGGRDLLADLLGRHEVHESRPLRVDARGKIAVDLPFRPCLADPWAWDLRAEDDPSFGGRLGPAAGLLVAGHGGQEDDCPLVRGVEQHLRRDHDIRVHAKRHPPERCGDRIRIGQRVQEVAPRRVENVHLAAARGFDHLCRREPALAANLEAVPRGQVCGGFGRDRDATRQGGRVRAHLGATLDPGMTADRHEPCARPANVSPREREVDDRLHVLGPADVLGHAHRPDDHRGPRRGVHPGEPLHVRSRRARPALEVVERLALERRPEVVPALGVVANEALVGSSRFDKAFEDAVDEGHVAARVNGKELVCHLRPKDRRLDVRRHPVTVEARLAIGVHHGDLEALLPP
jgi:hypothetical protein